MAKTITKRASVMFCLRVARREGHCGLLGLVEQLRRVLLVLGVALVLVPVGTLLAAHADVAVLATQRQAQVAKALHLHHPLELHEKALPCASITP